MDYIPTDMKPYIKASRIPSQGLVHLVIDIATVIGLAVLIYALYHYHRLYLIK